MASGFARRPGGWRAAPVAEVIFLRRDPATVRAGMAVAGPQLDTSADNSWRHTGTEGAGQWIIATHFIP